MSLHKSFVFAMQTSCVGDMSRTKANATFSIDREVLEDARKMARNKGYNLSFLVEKYLSRVVTPELVCFGCGRVFQAPKGTLCPNCHWLRCPFCKKCACDYDENTRRLLLRAKGAYEELLLFPYSRG